MLRISVTSISEALADDGEDQLTMVVPNGYNKLIGFYFNPSIAYNITVRSQKSKINILDSFRTSIGTFGYMELESNEIEDDRFIITVTNKNGDAQDCFLTGIFEAS